MYIMTFNKRKMGNIFSSIKDVTFERKSCCDEHWIIAISNIICIVGLFASLFLGLVSNMDSDWIMDVCQLICNVCVSHVIC